MIVIKDADGGFDATRVSAPLARRDGRARAVLEAVALELHAGDVAAAAADFLVVCEHQGLVPRSVRQPGMCRQCGSPLRGLLSEGAR